jgi:hypothetical protein
MGRDLAAWMLAMTCRGMLAVFRDALRPGITVLDWFVWAGAYEDVTRWPSLRRRATTRHPPRTCPTLRAWLWPLAPVPTLPLARWRRAMLGAAACGRVSALQLLWERNSPFHEELPIREKLAVAALRGRHNHVLGWLGAICSDTDEPCAYRLLLNALRAGYDWDAAEYIISWVTRRGPFGSRVGLCKLLRYLGHPDRATVHAATRLRLFATGRRWAVESEAFLLINSSPEFYEVYYDKKPDYDTLIVAAYVYLDRHPDDAVLFSLRTEQWDNVLRHANAVFFHALALGCRLNALQSLHAFLLRMGPVVSGHWSRAAQTAIRSSDRDIVAFLLEAGQWSDADRCLLSWFLRAHTFYGRG